ncbi:MAG: hypothetical protein ABIO70_11905 [Pseudomonadota bacterium]
MTTWHHPALGRVDPIVRKKQPEKVWKHLYDPAERWQDVCDMDRKGLEDEAIRAGCAPFLPSKIFPGVDWRTAKTLHRHHDRYYGPAYASEASHPDTAWVPKLADPERWVGRTPGAVLIFVQLGTPCRVKTAFRPLPPSGDVSGDGDVHQRQADYKFEKETGMTPDRARSLARQLAQATATAPSTALDAWWLALAVGQARLASGTSPELAGLRERGEQLLRATPQALLDGAIMDGALEITLDRLAEGLKDDEPEELEDALSDLEDLLMVGQVLSQTAATMSAVDQASELLAWLPTEFEAVSALAALRLDAMGRDDSEPVIRLWLAVEEASTAASIRETAPAERPAATLVDALLPTPNPLLDRVRAWSREGAAHQTAWARQVMGGLRIAPAPAPAMGSEEARPTFPTIYTPRVPGFEHCRAFVVDSEYPSGHDVTSLLVDGDANLWDLEKPGQSAVIVLVVGTTPIEGATLEDALDHAAGQEGAVVVARELTRPR